MELLKAAYKEPGPHLKIFGAGSLKSLSSVRYGEAPSTSFSAGGHSTHRHFTLLSI
jgi:hypothetical protein